MRRKTTPQRMMWASHKTNRTTNKKTKKKKKKEKRVGFCSLLSVYLVLATEFWFFLLGLGFPVFGLGCTLWVLSFSFEIVPKKKKKTWRCFLSRRFLISCLIFGGPLPPRAETPALAAHCRVFLNRQKQKKTPGPHGRLIVVSFLQYDEWKEQREREEQHDHHKPHRIKQKKNNKEDTKTVTTCASFCSHNVPQLAAQRHLAHDP